MMKKLIVIRGCSVLFIYFLLGAVYFRANAQGPGLGLRIISHFLTSQVDSNEFAQLTPSTQVAATGAYGFVGNLTVSLKAGLCFEGDEINYCRCSDVAFANAIKSTSTIAVTVSFNKSTAILPSSTSAFQDQNNNTIAEEKKYSVCDVNEYPYLVGGTTYVIVNRTLAEFRALRTWVAGSNVRVYIVGRVGGSTVTAFSNLFVVNPGEFQALRILAEPANIKGCARCPIGTFRAGSPLQASVALQDRANNTIAVLCVNVTSCSESTRRNVVVEFPQRSNYVTAVRVVSDRGVALFSNLTVYSSNSYTRLSFTTTLVGGFGSIISVVSQPFIVTNAAPYRPRVLHPDGPIMCANGSLILQSYQPKVEIVDYFNNTVVSDCFDENHGCAGSVPETCASDSTACNPNISAQLISQSAFLIGTATSYRTSSGLAIFTDLGVASRDRTCGTSTMVIRFSIQNVPVTFDKALILSPGAARLNIINQPPVIAVSDEPFSTPVQVQVLDCHGNLAIYVVAEAVGRINNAQISGLLRGKTTESVRSGMFFFSDLNIYTPARQLSLRFDYISYSSISPAISSTFDVYAPPTGLKILRQPSAEDPSQPTTAGRVFWLQPQVQLQPALPTTRSAVAIIVPGWDPGSLQWHDPGNVNSLSGNFRADFDVQGIARFTDLSVRKASMYQGLQNQFYRIRFSSDTLQIDSFTFQIFPAEWAGIFIPDSKQPIASIAANVLLIQPAICLVDRFLNLIQQLQPVTVSVILLGGPADTKLLVCLDSALCDASCVGAVCNFGTISQVAVDSVAQFENLAITQTSNSYHFFFSTSGFNVTSQIFAILAGNIVSLAVSNISSTSSADGPLLVQPVLTVLDRKGNIVEMPIDSLISYDLRTQNGYAVASGIPAQDAILLSMCLTGSGIATDLSHRSMESVIENSSAIFSKTAARFTNLTVHRAMRGFFLKFTLSSASRVFTVNSTAFSVTPGAAVGICAISLPSLCAVLAPCHQNARIVCVDNYDNVQPSCKRCAGTSCEVSTFINTSVPENRICPSNQICVKLFSGPTGASLSRYGTSVEDMIDCDQHICSASFLSSQEGLFDVPTQPALTNGGASFTDLVMNVSSLNYRLIFFVFTTNPYTLAVEEWSFVTPGIIVHPPPPIVSDVMFSSSMNQLRVLFNEDTNMNVVLEPGNLGPQDTSCSRNFNISFVNALGLNPICTWPTHSELLISLGYGAYVNTSTRFFLNSDSRILAKPIGNLAYSDLLNLQDVLLPSTTEEGAISAGTKIGKYFPRLPLMIPVPNPTVITKNFLGACDRFEADARLSSGDAKRRFKTVKWGLDFTATRFKNGILQSGRATRLFKTRIKFSSMLPGDMNFIEVSLMFNAPVLPGTIFKISGLPGYSKPLQTNVSTPIPNAVPVECFGGKGSCVSIPIQGPSALLFSRSVAQWSIETDDFLFQVNHTLFLPALEDIIFSFSMQNPSQFVSASILSISSEKGNSTRICLDPESVTCFRNVWYTFSSQPMEMNCGRLCMQTAVFEIADRSVSLVAGDISEYSKANGITNALKLRISPSHDLPPGALVIVGGFVGVKFLSEIICVHGPDAFRFGCLPCSQNKLPDCPGHDRFSAIGILDSAAGEISFVIKAGEKLAAGEMIEISFMVINPDQVNRIYCSAINSDRTIDQIGCPSLTKLNVQFRLSSLSNLPAKRFQLDGDVLGGGLFPRILHAGIIESNSFAGLSSVLHIEFVANVDLPPQTVITLAGIQGLDAAQQLVLYFNTGSCFSQTTGFFLQDSYSGSLYITIAVPEGCKLIANNVTSFDVKLRNPPTALSNQQALSLSASFIGCKSCIQGCGCDVTNLDYVLLQSHTVDNGRVLGSGSLVSSVSRLVAVDTFVPGQSNVLTMSLTFSASLKERSNVTISGIKGILSSFVNIVVSNGTQHKISAIVGAESIKFSTPWEITVGSNLVFRIFLINEIHSQNWTRVSAAVEAAVKICDDAILDYCSWFKAFNPLKPEAVLIPMAPIFIEIPIEDGNPALYSTSISGITQVPGAWNILTVSFIANFVIEGPGVLNITGIGLDRFVLPPTATAFSLKSEVSGLLPNCTCNSALENVPVDCSGCAIGDQAFAVWQPDKIFGDPVSRIARGYWGNGRLSIVLQRGASVPVGKALVFSFLVLNPAASVDVVCNVTLQSHPSFRIPSQLIENNLIRRVGTEPARFTSLAVQQSSTVAGDVNFITVQFTVNCPLVSFSSIAITVSGFQGFQTKTGYLPLTGLHSFNVAKKAAGNWSRENGHIVLLSGSIMNRCPMDGKSSSCPKSALDDGNSLGLIRYEFSFNLQNPSALNNGGYPIQISARTREVFIPQQSAGSGLFQSPVLGAMTLFPAFLFLNITESRKLQAVTNKILVQFSTSVDLYPVSSITIVGFENTLSQNGRLTITGANSSVFLHAFLSSGAIVLTVANRIGSNTIIEFEFTLINARNVQMGKKPSISGYATVKPVCVGRSVQDCTKFISSYLEPAAYSEGLIYLQRRIFDVNNFFSASVAPVLTFKSIEESTTVNFATNKITVIFASNVLIPSGSEITISGLFPSSSWKVRDSLLGLFGPSAASFGGYGHLISCNDISTHPVGFDSEVMCQLDNSERKLAVVLRSPLLPEINTSFSFKLPNGHNQCCSQSCDGNCLSFFTSVVVTGRNSGSEQNLEIASSNFDTKIFAAGGSLSWVVKHVHESSGVVNAMNKLTFSIRPNAPLYPGTQILISGLNLTGQKSCMKCFPEGNFGDMIPGLGCSDSTRSRCRSQVLCDSTSGVGDPDDTRCTPIFQANPEFQNMVYYPCLPIFNTDMNENTIFAIPTSFRKGVLNATIDVGQKIPEDEDTIFVIWLRNSQTRQSYGAEHQCLKGDISGVNCGSKLLQGISIVTSSSKLCDANQNPDTVEGCNDGDWTCSFINGAKVCSSSYFQGVPDIGRNSKAVDGHNQILRDSCATCVRQSDLVDFDKSLQQMNLLLIRDLPSGMKARNALPSLIEGGLTGGSYTIYLQLSNWIGAMKTIERTFLQIDRGDPSTFETHGLGGALGDEVVIPTSVIESMNELSIFSDQSVRLDCSGVLASCLNLSEAQNLLFFWRKGNETEILGKQSTFIVPRHFLNAGQTQSFVCQVKQGSLLGPKSTVSITVKVRDLEAHISGVADGGQAWIQKPLMISAGLTFDPEHQTTGLTNSRTDFQYTWLCEVLPVNTDEYLPCSEQTIANISAVDTLFDSTIFQVGDKVKIRLGASRREGRFSDLNTGDASDMVTFTIQDKETVNILAIQCDPTVMFSVNCNPLIGKFSSSNDPIVLEAVLPVVLSGQGITSYNWSIPDPYDGTLTPSLALSSLSQSVLILRPGALTPGKPVKFRVTVRDNFEFSGTAEVSIFVRIPPFGGSISVFPLNGSSLVTTFDLVAIGWTTDDESMPLSFKFSVAYPLETVVSRSMSMSSSAFLSTGDKSSHYAQIVILDVADCFGGVSRSSLQVSVFPFPSQSVTMIQTVFSEIYTPSLTTGYGFEALSLIQTVSSTLNDVNISCEKSSSKKFIGCDEVDECCQRAVFRSFLLQRLKETIESIPISIESVQNQASILAALTSRQGEIDFNFIKSCTEVLTASISAAMKVVNIDATDLPRIYAEILDQLFKSLESETVTSITSSAKMFFPRSLNAPDLYTRNLIWNLVQAISLISSLTVKDSKPAQAPYIVSTASMTIYTNRFFSSQTAQDLEIELNGTNLRAKVPKSFFATIGTNKAVDVMLAISYLSSALLPESFGPFIVLQARAGNPGNEFTLHTPQAGWGTIEMTLPFDLSVGDVNQFETVNKFSGTKRILYGKVFDSSSWIWKTAEGIRRLQGGQGRYITIESDTLGYFSVTSSFQGCDGVDLSTDVLDACGICGGDNSTCSGCDGIPKTGRNKNCSGHGVCTNELCACSTPWFGVMCEILCRDEVHCSGHGLCLGTRCTCERGYVSANISYPGPFCDRVTTSAPSGGASSQGPQSDDTAKTTLIMIVVPVLGGSLVCCALLAFFYTRKAKKIKKYRENILEFPQPQLAIPAEKRQHEIIMIPDETGWSNVEYIAGKLNPIDDQKWKPKNLDPSLGEHQSRIKTSAAFSYGPNSGQLVSAIAASTRASVCEMSTDVIERRVRNMQNQIRSRQTVSKYKDLGPVTVEPNRSDEQSCSEDDDLHHQDGDFTGKIVMLDQVTSNPEWLFPRVDMDPARQ